jgi:hypothetical protein
LREVASIVDSIEAMAVGDNAIKQCVCMILELALDRSMRWLIRGGRVVERNAFMALERVFRFHVKCALGYMNSARAVLRYPLERK